MKKTIISVIITVCVMVIINGVIIQGINKNHEMELEETINSYKDEIDCLVDNSKELETKYNELNTQMDELESGVYSMMNGEDYEISITIDGEKHTYKSAKKGLFKDKSHTVVTIN